MPQDNNKTVVMVFGTFDILHPGHLDFFKQAKALAKNTELVVSIARDENVKRIKNNWPLYNETQRLAVVLDSPLVDRVVFGGKSEYMPHIVQVAPDVIALGYDQEAYVDNLEKDLRNAKLNTKVVRLKAFKPNKFKSSIIKKQK